MYWILNKSAQTAFEKHNGLRVKTQCQWNKLYFSSFSYFLFYVSKKYVFF